MYTNIKSAISNARKRRLAGKVQRDLTRSLDANALTELGYPPDRVDIRQRRWFLNI